MRLHKFLAISGELNEPEEWQARGYGIVRLAEDKNIGRNLVLNSHIRDRVVFAGENFIGEQNPAIRARALKRVQCTSLSSGEIMPNDQKAIEKVKTATAKYSELLHLLN